ncbi:membrane-associated tyrosine- and threonine-specific cdc2-inhibitory kinase isoform X3 [Cervus elaphus]|uniref:membrane-associated tyrosine- and threonine-specific cdc2-inhibitory kinase isoform X3 n=1 Tax=Cervus canadensis TaxID=1574408 RepID=UPI001CA311BE|nr:membrane-associated tyrosine- and threonine-specific cdc2-inhibitory kinase isoform X3 [Cervus canadensis]XP_043771985.1 membrane-associated tyrosine- and threonine-specific cdc2-inhibitory kinase isoform X3 [Cervus elaphus]
MLMPAEGTPPPLGGTPVPVPAYFRHAEPGFSLKRPRGLSRSLPPRPPAKGSIPVSRLFPPRTPGWHQPHARRVSFRDQASEPLQSPGYDPSRPESFFQQSFHRLGRLGHGSYGEVFKVRSKEDGRLYAVKRSMSPFRGPKDRTRKLAEVGGHEKVGQHPRCVRLEQAWEEGGILYLQTELCGPSLQQHCEAWGAGLPEAQVWGYLRDTLLALAHLHGQGLVHLDVKPANIFLGPRGRCKLGDFGLLVELGASGASEAQEGDPRYMAPELLQGSYGTAADVFSLGLTILEVACNMELPRGGEGWQRLRQGYLPPEFTAGLSSELRSVLVTMLEPDPNLRATAEALLALPVLRQPRPWSVLWFMAAEALSRGWALWQALLSLLCWLWHGLAHPASWLQPPGPPATPPGSPPCSLLLDRSLSSTWGDDSIGWALTVSRGHPGQGCRQHLHPPQWLPCPPEQAPTEGCSGPE